MKKAACRRQMNLRTGIYNRFESEHDALTFGETDIPQAVNHNKK